MKTLTQWRDKINADNRTTQEATRSEIVEALEIIADDMMRGRTTLAHPDLILSLRFALMSEAEKNQDAKSAGAALRAVNSPAQQDAARANGAKGGRPRLTPSPT